MEKLCDYFFDPLKTESHSDHFEHFPVPGGLVVLTAFAWGRRNISVLYRHLDARSQPYRSRFNNFINVARCDPQAMLRKKAYEPLAAVKPGKGDVVELIIDDSKQAKRGKEMDAVNWTHDPVSGRSILSHQYVQATIRFAGDRT